MSSLPGSTRYPVPGTGTRYCTAVQYCTVIWIVVSYSYVLYSTIPGHVYRIAHMATPAGYSTVVLLYCTG